MNFHSKKIEKYLGTSPAVVFNLYCIAAAFMTYFCMYSFRKPFAVGVFQEVDPIFGVDYKIVLILSQVIGYTLSKFLGVKVVSEASTRSRALDLLLLIGIAEAALLGFALVPAPYNFIFLFINGLPLGMVWGLVFGFLGFWRGEKLRNFWGPD